jgi:glutaredoxin-like protein NrdH
LKGIEQVPAIANLPSYSPVVFATQGGKIKKTHVELNDNTTGGQDMPVTHVPGKNQAEIMLYALSTCPWCRKTKQLLNDQGVEYDFIDVDQTRGQEREDVINAVRKYNPALSFPVIVINGKAITGFREDEIKEALKAAAAR